MIQRIFSIMGKSKEKKYEEYLMFFPAKNIMAIFFNSVSFEVLFTFNWWTDQFAYLKKKITKLI